MVATIARSDPESEGRPQDELLRVKVIECYISIKKFCLRLLKAIRPNSESLLLRTGLACVACFPDCECR